MVANLLDQLDSPTEASHLTAAHPTTEHPQDRLNKLRVRLVTAANPAAVKLADLTAANLLDLLEVDRPTEANRQMAAKALPTTARHPQVRLTLTVLDRLNKHRVRTAASPAVDRTVDLTEANRLTAALPTTAHPQDRLNKLRVRLVMAANPAAANPADLMAANLLDQRAVDRLTAANLPMAAKALTARQHQQVRLILTVLDRLNKDLVHMAASPMGARLMAANLLDQPDSPTEASRQMVVRTLPATVALTRNRSKHLMELDKNSNRLVMEHLPSHC